MRCCGWHAQVLSCSVYLLLQLMRLQYELDDEDYSVLEAYMSPDVIDNPSQATAPPSSPAAHNPRNAALPFAPPRTNCAVRCPRSPCGVVNSGMGRDHGCGADIDAALGALSGSPIKTAWRQTRVFRPRCTPFAPAQQPGILS